jgi:hypothetical protein
MRQSTLWLKAKATSCPCLEPSKNILFTYICSILFLIFSPSCQIELNAETRRQQRSSSYLLRPYVTREMVNNRKGNICRHRSIMNLDSCIPTSQCEMSTPTMLSICRFPYLIKFMFIVTLCC